MSERVAKRFDKADKFFDFPLSEDLSLAVSVLSSARLGLDIDTHETSCNNVLALSVVPNIVANHPT